MFHNLNILYSIFPILKSNVVPLDSKSLKRSFEHFPKVGTCKETALYAVMFVVVWLCVAASLFAHLTICYFVCWQVVMLVWQLLKSRKWLYLAKSIFFY